MHGDNPLALKAPERQYAGPVKCIYLDSPITPALHWSIMMLNWSTARFLDTLERRQLCCPRFFRRFL